MDHLTVLLLALCTVSYSTGARILGIAPSPSISHQQPFQAVMKALAARGHEITVISPTPLKTPVPNYTDVDVSFSHASNTRKYTEYFKNEYPTSPYKAALGRVPLLSTLVDEQLCSASLQEFIRSNDSKFDVVFLQAIVFQSYHGLVHRVGSPPVIGFLSAETYWTEGNTMGNPVNPSYHPNIVFPFSDHMTFYERLQNTIFWIWIRYFMHTVILPDQEAIMRKHFGPSPPSVEEADRNMSLLMVSSNWLFNYPIPLVPAVIPIHSVHVKTQPDPLPQDLQQFLDEATEGVIYFTLGSMIRSDHMTDENRRVFLEAFSEISLKVLWKWESDILPGQPSNVRIEKWLPQQDILAHRNVRMFITHCGAQSFQEAVYHAVPLLGIPVYSDQLYNARKIEDVGIGIRLSFSNLTKEILLNAINEIVSDPRYESNMKRMSAISKDEPQTSIEKAVWWTEYVLRHKGAKHLRSAAFDLTWYQYFLLDVLALIIFITVVLILITYICFRTIYRYLKQGVSGIKSKRD